MNLFNLNKVGNITNFLRFYSADYFNNLFHKSVSLSTVYQTSSGAQSGGGLHFLAF
jgi:hypothetical protein